ncbi:MAG TPA: NAD(P)H-binding protein, partial [Thermoanaerobaculia bacterium]
MGAWRGAGDVSDGCLTPSSPNPTVPFTPSAREGATYAIAGISGNVGGAAARALLDRGERIRAIVRDPAKGGPWASRGAEVALADLADAQGLASAFEGADAAFVLNPPAYRDPDFIARSEELASAIFAAARDSGLRRLV